MDEVRKFTREKFDITEEDVINYVKKHKPRFILAAIVFVLQFLVVFIFMRGNPWKERYSLTRLWILLWVILLLTILELLRYGDFLFKKYGVDKLLGGEGGRNPGSVGSKASSVDSSASNVKSNAASTLSAKSSNPSGITE